MSHQANITRIKAVYNALAHLKDQVVFVGGATVSLYVDQMAEEARPTDDVDVVVEVLSLAGYAAIEDQLRKIGFVNDQESKIICRYKVQGITVDIMPTVENVLGFQNKWYPEGFINSIDHFIDEHHTVRIFSLSYFIASKLDAFTDRSGNDGRTSTDFEDIVYVLEFRRAVWNDLDNAPTEVKTYLRAKFKELLANPYFQEWVDGHVSYGSPPATYFIIERLKMFVG